MVTYRSVPAHDELHRDGESLVLIDGEVQRVSALGTLIRAQAVEPATVEGLAAVLEEEFGPPPEGTSVEVTQQAVDVLVETGLLERLDAPRPSP